MPECLITGGVHDPFLPEVLDAIRHSDEIEFAVAFIKSSGLELLFDALSDAVIIRGTKLTLLTSDYLDVTDPQALRSLMLLSERGADVRLFQAERSQSFHLKAYIFLRNLDSGIFDGAAFIGSSNISRTALTDGIEWNYRLSHSEGMTEESSHCFEQIHEEYKQLLYHPSVIQLKYDWINAYEQRRKLQCLPIAPGSDDPELPVPLPNEVQTRALQALADSRNAGYQRGLVVMATGLGKTYLAAFDSSQMDAKRILFVAHIIGCPHEEGID